jgi:hypothetical protein
LPSSMVPRQSLDTTMPVVPKTAYSTNRLLEGQQRLLESHGLSR